MNNTVNIDVILVAAGRGERIGAPENGPKQYRLAAGKPLIAYTLSRFATLDWCRNIYVVHHADDTELLSSALNAFEGQYIAVIGGETRQASVMCGLKAASTQSPDYVMIHDAVRPFVTPENLSDLRDALSPENGALLAHPIADSLMRTNAQNEISEPIDRSNMWGAETPQCFPFETILDAHQRAQKDNQAFTDDTSLAAHYGLPSKIVENQNDNFKITYAADLTRAHSLLRGHDMQIPDIRTGNGYDVHSTMPGDHVTLCGVEIPAQITLNGHSDADVGMHALTDALLSTIAAGDIGTHFPPSDDQWRGAASHIFLSHAAKLVREAKGTVTHCAVTLICEAPKIGPHRKAMTKKLSDAIGIDPKRISITATTNEAIGFVGRGEGIAAIATATVVFPPMDIEES